jgi:hypothetical protein
MIQFIVGAVFGFFVATIGFSGIVNALDSGVDKVKNTTVQVETK